MGRRQNLNDEFKLILGNNNVYYQPPESVKIKYPAIIYKLSSIAPKYADNKRYKMVDCYEAILITKDPESEAIKKMLEHFTHIDFLRFYTANNLNHYAYRLYY